jgi:hypothetical protein
MRTPTSTTKHNNINIQTQQVMRGKLQTASEDVSTLKLSLSTSSAKAESLGRQLDQSVSRLKCHNSNKYQYEHPITSSMMTKQVSYVLCGAWCAVASELAGGRGTSVLIPRWTCLWR